MRIIRDDADFFLCLKRRPRNIVDTNGPQPSVGIGYRWLTGEMIVFDQYRGDLKLTRQLEEWAAECQKEEQCIL